jgi:hypothetical protein
VHFTPEMLELVPREIAERHCLLPVYLRKGRPRRKIPSILFLAMADPADAEALEECGFCSGITVKPLAAERWAIEDAIPIVYAGGSPVWERQARAHPSGPSSATPTALPPVAPARSAETTVEVSEASLDDLGDLGDLGDLDDHGPHSQGEAPADTIRNTSEPATSEEAPRSDPTRARRSERPQARHSEPPRLADGHSEPPRLADGRSEPPESQGFALLVVSASAAMADFCREAAEPLGGRVHTCDVVEAPVLAMAERPRFLIVSEEIYPFDRRAFNLLALEIGAPLVVWSLDMSPEDLQALLLAAGKKRGSSGG